MLDISGVPAARWYGRALRWPLRLVPEGTVVRVLQGPLRGARWIVGSHTHGCWIGTYEAPRQRALQRLLRPGQAFYDVGANVGFFTLLAARLVGPTGRVIAVEPLPRNLALLRRHLALNRVENVAVIAAACAAGPGPRTLEVDSPATAHLAAGGDLVVPVTSVDHLARGAGAPTPDVIKIDVEGAELEVLEGAEETLRRARPVVVLSTHSPELRTRCHRVLHELGYVLAAEHAGTAVEESDEVIAHPRRARDHDARGGTG